MVTKEGCDKMTNCTIDWLVYYRMWDCDHAQKDATQITSRVKVPESEKDKEAGLQKDVQIH